VEINFKGSERLLRASRGLTGVRCRTWELEELVEAVRGSADRHGPSTLVPAQTPVRGSLVCAKKIKPCFSFLSSHERFCQNGFFPGKKKKKEKGRISSPIVCF